MERSLHEAVAQFLAVALPREAFWFHPPNGEYRTDADGARLKRMGTKAGVPDVCLVYGGKFYGIELKARRGRLSEAQHACHRAIRLAGCDVIVARSLTEVALALEAWQIPLSARIAA